MGAETKYNWTDNPTESGVAVCDTDVLNDCLMHLKYENIGLNKITNCLLEVPQNIKLELNDGVLTLKAGSKVIVPNGKNTDGSLRFDEVVIESDITGAFGNGVQKMVFLNPNKTSINNATVSTQTSSGASNTSTSSYVFWYDTTNNFVKFSGNSGSTWTNGFSLPICLVNGNDNIVTSIDQVFNGIGYIGSTVWVDKGVKGLIPNGRNEDGTLKNIEFTLPNILVSSLTGSTRDMVAIIYNGGTSYSLYRGFYKDYKYDAEANVNMNLQAHPKWDMVPIGYTLGDITKLVVKQPVSLFDPNNVMSMPIELYGASGHLGLFGGSIFTHNMNLSIDTPPTTNTYEPIIEQQDKDNVRKSRLESFWKADGSHGIQLSEKHGSSYSAVTAGFDANGNPYTYAPHCNITNGIVTQAGLSKATNGYMKLGNGMILQWGVHSSGSGGNEYTITLPTAFSNTNYSVVGVSRGDKVSNSDYQVHLKITSKTQFKKTGQVATGLYWFAIGY